MKSLISWFVKNPVASNLMMFTMFAAGVFGYSNLDREFIPKVTITDIIAQKRSAFLIRISFKKSKLFFLSKKSLD